MRQYECCSRPIRPLSRPNWLLRHSDLGSLEAFNRKLWARLLIAGGCSGGGDVRLVAGQHRARRVCRCDAHDLYRGQVQWPDFDPKDERRAIEQRSKRETTCDKPKRLVLGDFEHRRVRMWMERHSVASPRQTKRSVQEWGNPGLPEKHRGVSTVGDSEDRGRVL